MPDEKQGRGRPPTRDLETRKKQKRESAERRRKRLKEQGFQVVNYHLPPEIKELYNYILKVGRMSHADFVIHMAEFIREHPALFPDIPIDVKVVEELGRDGKDESDV